MKRARWHALLAAGLVALACLGVTVRQTAADDNPRQMLEGLRDRGLYDEALDYLEKMRTSPMVAEQFKATIDYEAGVTLAAAARAVEQPGPRGQKLERAQASFEQFLGAHPDHDLAPDATVQLGNVLTERGRFKSLQTLLVADLPGEKERLAQEARALFGQAQLVFASAEKLHVAALKKFPLMVPPNDTETLAKRNRVRAGLLTGRLTSAMLVREIGKTYEPGSKRYVENLAAAAGRFHELYEKYGTYMAGQYARKLEGECYKDLGENAKALEVFDELVEMLPAEAKAFRVLRNRALLLTMETRLLPDVKQYREAVGKARAWVESAGPGEAQTPDGLAICYLAGVASMKLAEAAGPHTRPRREHLLVASDCLRAVAHSPGEYRQRAKAWLEHELFAAPAEPPVEVPLANEMEIPPLDPDLEILQNPSEAPDGGYSTGGAFFGRSLSGRGTGTGRVVEGGPTEGSKRAVDLALKWLAEHQFPDGGWSFDHTRAPACHGQCGNPGELKMQARNAATGLALLPFLGAGQTHKTGKYKSNVKRGLYFLVSQMKVSPQGGSLHESGGSMYSHGICSIVLCEAYAMTHDKGLYAPAQQAINFIAYAQDPVGGGWRYSPRQKGDTSITGWQVMALVSGRLAGLRVPPETAKKVNTFLDSVQASGGANYGYTTPGSGSATTAIGLLARMHLGWKRDNPALARGVKWLSAKGPYPGNMYYNYYATRVMFHAGGNAWEKWNGVMRDQLVNSQATNGHEAGSWHFEKGDHGTRRGGRLYSTAMATMILEVYYSHLGYHDEHPEDEEFPLD